MKMKSMLLAAALVMSASGAFAQGQVPNCNAEYGACMGRCVAQNVASLQERCSQSCEARTNMCFERVYGSKSSTSAPSNAVAPQAKDAMARKQQGNQMQPAADQAPAPAPEPEPKQ